MPLYFAYGSNMSRALMRARCPTAQLVDVATLPGWRFLINCDGYASIARQAGGRVHGAMWRVTPGDLAALNAYEAVDIGLYRRCVLSVRAGGRRRAALVYVGRDATPGRPRPGYLQVLVEAGDSLGFPKSYMGMMQRLSKSRWPGALATEPGRVR